MNFLAHALLSGPSPEMVVGGLVADWVKAAREVAALPPGVRAGIDLHRRVDVFTDAHPAAAASRRRVRERGGWGHFAGVLVDVWYDHCLARDWGRWSAAPLPEFAAGVYAALARHAHLLPEPSRQAARRMADEDWLCSYATADGVALALSRMSQRLKREARLELAVRDLLAEDVGLVGDFRGLFPDLAAHAPGGAVSRPAAAPPGG